MAEVVIELNSRIVADETDAVSINTVGDMTWEEDLCCLAYESNEEDGTPVSTVIRVGGGLVTVQQRGSSHSHLSIREGERAVTQYETSYGSLSVGINGKRVCSSLTPMGGDLLLEYDVDINAEAVSSNIIEIHVRRISSDV